MLNILKSSFIILICIAFCSAQIEFVTRNLNQKSEDLGRTYVDSEEELVKALLSKNIHSIFIEADEISLNSFIEINNGNLVIGCYSSANTKPIVRCTNSRSGILIRSQNVTIENLEIVDCQATSITMESNGFDTHHHDGSEEEDTFNTYDYSSGEEHHNDDEHNDHDEHHHHHDEEHDHEEHGDHDGHDHEGHGDHGDNDGHDHEGHGDHGEDDGHHHELLLVVLKNLVFKNNVNLDMFGVGGAIIINDGFEVQITGCHFENNYAGDGGGIYSEGHSHIHIKDTKFVNNTAEFAGGAIYASMSENDHFHKIDISRCEFFINSVLTGREDTNGDSLPNGVPVENAKFLEFSFPAPSGGAIYVSSFGSVEITNAIFSGNSAVSAGGAISFLNNLNVKIEKSTFKNNYVKKPEENLASSAHDLEHGGAIYSEFKGTAHSTGAVSDFSIRLSTFTNNTASYGGALHLITDLTSKVSLEYCTFNENLAKMAGGGILARNILHFELLSLKFSKNRAGSGGGVVLTNGASAQFMQNYNPFDATVSIFEENEAMDGGGLFMMGSGTVNLQSTVFRENKAERYGGGVCAIDSLPSGRIGIQETEFYKNSASKGGAAFLDSIAKVDLIVTRSALYNNFTDNVALAGGAFYVHIASQIYNNIFFNNAYYNRNKAVANKKNVFGDYQFNIPDDIFTQDSNNSRKLLHRIEKHKSDKDSHNFIDTRGKEPCYPGGGGAICWVLTDIPDRAPANILLTNSIFKNNEANVGGGVMIAINDQSLWQSECYTVTTAASCLAVEACKSILMENNTFNGNIALNAGGAIFATNPELISFRNKENQMIYLSEIDKSDREFFKNNKIKSKMGYGKNMASNAKSLKLIDPLPLEKKTNTSNDNRYGLVFVDHKGGSELNTIKIKVNDAYNNIVSSGVKDSRLTASIDSSILSGQLVSKAIHGTVTFEQIIATALPSNYDIIMETNHDDIQHLTFSISIRDCQVGERNLTENKVCTRCETGFFGFDPLLPCEACPEHAHCTGGSVIVPEDSYWHSNPFSPQIHKCIEEDACSYEDRKKHLISYYEKIKNNYTINVHNFNVDEYNQCAEGYTGVLCGSCAEGYAHSAGEDCVECYETTMAVTITSILLLWTLVAFVITIKSTLETIQDIQDMTFINESPTQSMNSSSDLARNPSDATCIEVFDEEIQSSISSKDGDEKKQGNLEVEELYADEKMSEIIKIIVNFFQITSIGVEISLDWTIALSNLLMVEGGLANFDSTTQFAPLECLLGGDSATKTLRGIQIQIIMPFVLMLLVIFIFYLLWLRNRRKNKNASISYIKSRAIICLLVGIFFAYDTITELFFRILNCITVDKDVTDENSAYDSYGTAKKWYWTSDTGIECLSKRHAIMVYMISIPGLIVFTFGIPLFLSIFLIKCRNEKKTYDKEFLNTYGFVYQSYRPDFIYWEAAIMLRKICIDAIIVYGYSIGPNLQSAIVMGILIIASIAHHVVKPFKYDLLNNLESLSLLGSICVFYAGIVFADTHASDPARFLLGLLIFLINIVLTIIFLYYLFKSADKLLHAKLRVIGIKENEIPKSIYGKLGSLSKVQAITIKKKVDSVSNKIKMLSSSHNKRSNIVIGNNSQCQQRTPIDTLNISTRPSTEIPNPPGIEENNVYI